MKSTSLLPMFVIAGLMSPVALGDDYEKALIAKNKQDYDAADVHIRNLLKDEPGHLPGLLLKADVLLAQNLPAQAQAELESARSKGVDMNHIIAKLATTLFAQSKYAEVLELDQRVTLNSRVLAQFQLERARALHALGRSTEALAILDTQLANTNITSSAQMRLGLKRAGILVDMNAPSEAQVTLSEITQNSAPNAQYWYLSGRIQTLQGQHNEAVTSYNKAIAMDADKVSAYLALAKAYTVLKEFELALSATDKVLALAPNDLVAVYTQSEIFKQTNRPKQAQKALDFITNRISLVDDYTLKMNPELMLIDAMSSYAAQKLPTAIAKFESYLTRQPDNLDAVVLLSQVHQANNDDVASVALLSRYQRELSAHPNYALVLAGAYVKNNQLNDAETLLQRYLVVSSDSPNMQPQRAKAKLLLAQTVYQQGRMDESQQYINDLIALDPNVASVYANWLAQQGDKLLSAQQFSGAFDYYKDALKASASNIDTVYKFTGISRELNRGSEASQLLETLVATYPKRTFLKEVLGEHLLENGEHEKALFYYSKLLTAPLPSIKRAIALNNLAYLHITQSQYDLAVTHAQQALALRDDIPTFYDTLGWALTKSGDYVKGKEYLEKALSLAGDSPEIQAHLDYTLRKLAGA